MDKFLQDTYFSPVHIRRTPRASPLSRNHYWLQKNPEYLIKSGLKDKTLYCRNEFVLNVVAWNVYTFQLPKKTFFKLPPPPTLALYRQTIFSSRGLWEFV